MVVFLLYVCRICDLINTTGMPHLKGFHKDRGTNFTSKQEFRQKKKKKDEGKAISRQQTKQNQLHTPANNMT